MKKIISLLFLFAFSLFMVNSQSKITYIDSLKSVTVSVSTDTKKQLDTQKDLQSQFAKVVDSQTVVNEDLSNGIDTLVAYIDMYTEEVEQRNKNDSQLLTDKFNYSSERVKHVIKIERWLNFITLLLVLIYLSFVYQQLNTRRSDYEHIFSRALLYIILGALIFIVVQNLLTLLFNGDFYVIKELITLYT
jgi:hypothetical protein